MKDPLMVMKALSDPNRVKIMKMLQNKVMCVCEIRTALVVNQPSASKHLKILEDAELVDFSKEGSWVNYKIADSSTNPYATAMLAHMQGWLTDDKEIAEMILKAKVVNRARINAA